MKKEKRKILGNFTWMAIIMLGKIILNEEYEIKLLKCNNA